jgi:hypothetical protein
MIPLAVGVVVVVFYIPVALIALLIASELDAAYIFLSLFTIGQRHLCHVSNFLKVTLFLSVRVVGGALLIAARKDAGLYTAAYILDSVGLSLLLLSTLGFLGLGHVSSFSWNEIHLISHQIQP